MAEYAGGGSAPVLVLVVDDDVTTRMLMRTTLEQAGYRVIDAENGALAVERFSRDGPQLILMDVEMPVMDGFTACSTIRTLEGGTHVPIVMVTGLEDHDSVNRAYDAGATDFIHKPINWTILAHRIRYILRAGKAFNQVQISETRTRAFLRAMPDMVLRIKQDGRLRDWQGGYDERLFPPGKGVITSLAELFPAQICRITLDYGRRAIESNEALSYEFQLFLGGRDHFFEGRVVKVEKDEFFLILRNITEKKAYEQQIHSLVYSDAVTDLPNRVSFLNQLKQSLLYAQRHRSKGAVLLLDLDHFKRINDSLGHQAGDELLIAVSRRLREYIAQVNRSDAHQGMSPIEDVARLGGDEFGILISQNLHDEYPGLIASNILKLLNEPFLLEEHEVVVTASIGIVILPDDGDDVDSLLKNADIAMYQAKAANRNNYQYFSPTTNKRAVERLHLEGLLRKAIDRNELELHFQPQLDLTTGAIVGFEALLRWHQRELGQISPVRFIPLAEESGLIHPIGEWVLYRACEQMREWSRQAPGLKRIGVNISAPQFRDRNLLQIVRRALDHASLDPRLLDVELTEGIIMTDAPDTARILTELRDMGVGRSVDDFGTGYSSLSYLKHFPLDILKIDRTFVNDIDDRRNEAAIVNAIIMMAKGLDLKVIAEGVETVEQLNFLRKKGCDEIQGFLISRPVPATEVPSLLTKTWPIVQS